MVTSFADGSKISFERSIVANATGFKVRSRGMSRGREYRGDIMEIGKLYDLDELRGMTGIVDYVVGTPLTNTMSLFPMPDPIIPLIMCGGRGTRLWPASREGRPKQFLRLFGPRSTFQETLRRVGDQPLFGRPIVITNTQYRFRGDHAGHDAEQDSRAGVGDGQMN